MMNYIYTLIPIALIGFAAVQGSKWNFNAATYMDKKYTNAVKGMMCKHIRLKIKETEVLKGIKCDGLPKSAKMYLILLNMHLYIPALLAAKLITVIRGK